MNRISNILVGVDFSSSAARALGYAAQLAMQSGARLHVLNMYGNAASLVRDPFSAGLSAEAYIQRLREDLEHRRTALEQLITQEVSEPFAGKVQASPLLREGEPQHGILQAAADLKVDLVVVGTRGKSMVERMLMGSVSTHLCQHSAIPVLVVPAPGRDA